MATRYWVGGTGVWTNNNTHWSATSGGAGGATFPTQNDDVIFDANSGVGNFTCTLNPNQNPTCRNFTMSNCTGTITGNPSTVLSVWGTSFTLDPTGTFDPVNYPAVTFAGTAGCNITCSTQSMGNVNFSGGASAIYNFLDNFKTYEHSTTVTVYSGTINAGTHDVNVGAWIHAFAANKTINMGSGTWYLSGNGLTGSTNPWIWQMDAHTTLNKQTANIVLTSTTTDDRMFGCATQNPFIYNQLTIGASTNNGQFSIRGTNSFTALNSVVVGENNIDFDSYGTQTFDEFNISGTAGNLVTIFVSDAPTQATLVKTSGYWYVGANSQVYDSTNVVASAGAGIDYLVMFNILGLPAIPPPPPNNGNFFMLLK